MALPVEYVFVSSVHFRACGVRGGVSWLWCDECGAAVLAVVRLVLKTRLGILGKSGRPHTHRLQHGRLARFWLIVSSLWLEHG